VILASTGRSGFLFRRVMLDLDCFGVDDTSQGVSLLPLVLLASDWGPFFSLRSMAGLGLSCTLEDCTQFQTKFGPACLPSKTDAKGTGRKENRKPVGSVVERLTGA
jgi:hypothetical protein